MAEEFLIDTDDLQRRMNGALSAMRSEFSSLRTGRASSSMLDPITVEVYGQRTPLNQLGTINVPEPRMVTINVWDKTNITLVEKAIRESGLGINPQLNGTIIMLPIPELNEERRRELSKVAGHYAESARVAVRNIRRDGMDQIKKQSWMACQRMIKNSGKRSFKKLQINQSKILMIFLMPNKLKSCRFKLICWFRKQKKAAWSMLR